MPAGGYPLVKARLSPSAQYRRDQARDNYSAGEPAAFSARPAAAATSAGTSFYQLRGDKSGNPDSKVVITDRKMIQAGADANRPHSK
jgi:hypothetical protein